MGHRDLLVTHNLSDGKCHYCWPHPRGSVRRASGFVLTGYSETTRSWNSRLPGQLVSACPDSLAHHPECAFSSGNMGFSSTTLNPTSQSISVVWVVCRHVGLCNLLQNSVRKRSP